MEDSEIGCGDCWCAEGELHEDSCCEERCPICGSQLISCGCHEFNPYKYDSIPVKNKEPCFTTVYCCKRCGVKSPSLKVVSKEEWEFICGKTYDLKCLLCPECIDFIKEKREKFK